MADINISVTSESLTRCPPGVAVDQCEVQSRAVNLTHIKPLPLAFLISRSLV